MTQYDPGKERSPYRANDIWISAGLMATLITIFVGAYTLNKSITDGAIAQEQRFTRLEEKLKALQDDLQALKFPNTERNVYQQK